MMTPIEPGTIIVSDKGTDLEAWFIVMPSTLEKWITALQISGPTLKPGECFCRNAPLSTGIFGRNYEVVKDREFRMIARDGIIRTLLLPLNDQSV